MARKSLKQNTLGNRNGANLGFEVQLGQAANALSGSMDTKEYKYVALELIFLKIHFPMSFKNYMPNLKQNTVKRQTLKIRINTEQRTVSGLLQKHAGTSFRRRLSSQS